MFEQFASLVTATTATSGAAAVNAWTRLENASCARRLAAMLTMLDTAYTAAGSAHREQWHLDNWGAVCAHIGACQRISSDAASHRLLVALALRERFPNITALFQAGLIDYPMARLIVTRANQVTDPAAITALDAQLAAALSGDGAPVSLYKAQQVIDAAIWALDPFAVHRTQTRARGREVQILIDDATGMAEVFATVLATDGAAADARFNALAATVCPADPRTHDQLRADAFGALGRGEDRLTCQCGTHDCPAGALPPSTGVVIHLVVDHDTITDPPPAPEPAPDEPSPPPAPPAPTPDEEVAGLHGHRPPLFDTTTAIRDRTLTEALTNPPGHRSTLPPAVLLGRGVLPATIARHCARTATIRDIVHPGQAPPEPHYRPSKKLAEFIRCRDLTCRFPGCKVPATHCDLDHTIPWPHGPTHASNLKCLCRTDHLLKTFYGGDPGWRDEQLPDGTVIWTAPDGATHTTHPGSRLLFPRLCTPTAPVIPTATPPTNHTTGLQMPRRRHTRTQDRTHRIQEQREHNRTAIEEDHLNALDHIIDDYRPPPF